MYYLEGFDFDLQNKILLPSTLNEYKDVVFFVMVKANWCGHCKNATPEFEKAAEMAKNMNMNVIFCFADITGETEDEKALKDKVKMFKNFMGFPHFSCHMNGSEMKPYVGQRTAESFLTFLKNCQ